jgi:hypothetical protein
MSGTKKQFDFFLGYAVALYICLLGWALFIVLKFHYGTFKINKLTLRPFFWACLFFIVNIIYFIAFAIVTANWTDSQFQDWHVYMKKPIFILGELPLLLLSQYCYLGFLSTILFEQHVLLVFIVFQKHTDPN